MHIDTYHVETSGSIQDTYKLNYLLRTAHRVLFGIAVFQAPDIPQLIRQIKKIAWEDYIPLNGYFSISSSVYHPRIRDSRYANLIVKDAIADRFNEKYAIRPDSGNRKDKCTIFYYWNESKCAVFLDTTGVSLSRHGYRLNPWKAPMMESLAACVIYAAGWDGKSHFVNPMCGSGTLAIEAALMATDIYPGKFRTNYSFIHFKNFDDIAWYTIRSNFDREPISSIPAEIVVTDIDKKAVDSARINAREAGVEHLITFKVCPFSETPIPTGDGIIIVNPEYGERMGEIEKLGETYSAIGDFFKQKGKGYTGYIFTGNMDLAKKVGLRTSRKISFLNGNIGCRLLEYELYLGTRKTGRSVID